MFLRRMMAVVCPPLLCLICCLLFRWLDRLMNPVEFLSFFIKGLLLGIALALVLPAAGITARTSGLTGWLYGAAGILLLILIYQYLESANIVHIEALRVILSINGQVVFAQSAVMGFTLITALLSGRRRG